MYEWYINEWVHLMVLNPETDDLLYFKDGNFHRYTPLPHSIEKIESMVELVEKAKEMETNNIVDATRENLPVYLIN